MGIAINRMLPTKYVKHGFFFLVVLVLIAAVLFTISGNPYRRSPSRKPVSPAPTAHLSGPTTRLRDFASCHVRDFEETPKNRLPPRDYIATWRFQQTPVMPNKSDVRTLLLKRHKNDVRIVEHPLSSNRSRHTRHDELPTVYVITPTYARFAQKTDLLRLCYTLMHVPRLHWIVVEDSAEETAKVKEILANCPGPSVTHLATKTPNTTKHRGVTQRNAGLDWIRRCVLSSPNAGGVFFGDDDNTYDLLLFEAVRWTDKVSVWPVGIVGGALWEGPVCLHGKVIGFEGRWGKQRAFPLDMAAFSIGVNFLLSTPKAALHLEAASGHLETDFLRNLSITMEDMKVEPDANCSQVLAWHTQNKKGNFTLPTPKNMTKH